MGCERRLLSDGVAWEVLGRKRRCVMDDGAGLAGMRVLVVEGTRMAGVVTDTWPR